MSSTSCSGTSSPKSSPIFSDPSTPETENDAVLEDQSLAINEHQYVLVTGGLGFIGSHTSLELLKAGYNVIIVDDLSNSYQDVFDRIQEAANRHFESIDQQCPKADFYNANYRDISTMRTLLESYSTLSPDGKRRSQVIGVIHFAAFKAVEDSIRNPLKYYQNNISGLIDFINLLDEMDSKTFIFSSSATVYGNIAERASNLREQNCTHQHQACDDEEQAEQGYSGITNPYGRTKFFGEAILADVATSNPSWTFVGLRYFNPIGCDPSGLLGEDPRGVPSNLLPVTIKVLTGQYQELLVYGQDWNTPDGTAIRDFIHVTDVARGHIVALSAAHNGQIQGNFRAFNLGTGLGHSVKEVITTMESVSGRSIPRRIVDRRDGDVQSSVANVDRVALELGWKSEKSLRDACQDLWNYIMINP